MDIMIFGVIMVIIFIQVESLLIGTSVVSDQEDEQLLITCGPISCDITYQYCDKDLLGTRPVCSLCADICSIKRIGTERLNVEQCLDICPVYWYRQENAKLSTTTTTAHLSTSRSELPLIDSGETTTNLVVLVTVLVIVSMVIIWATITVVVKRRRYVINSHTGANNLENHKNATLSNFSLKADSGYDAQSNDDLGLTNLLEDVMDGSRTSTPKPSEPIQQCVVNVQNVCTSTTGLINNVHHGTDPQSVQVSGKQVQTDQDETTPKRPRPGPPRMVTHVGSGTFKNFYTCPVYPNYGEI